MGLSASWLLVLALAAESWAAPGGYTPETAIVEAREAARERFAEQVTQFHGTSVNTGEWLMKLGTAVTPADLAWVLAEQAFSRGMMEQAHLSPEFVLLQAPGLRLAGKMMGNASSSLEQGFVAPRPAAEEETEAKLWEMYGEDLKDLSELGTIPNVRVEDLLWLKVAMDLDKTAWENTPLTAEDLLLMPEYGVYRKLMADVVSKSLARCVGGVGAVCDILVNQGLRWCKALRDACDVLPPFTTAGCLFGTYEMHMQGRLC